MHTVFAILVDRVALVGPERHVLIARRFRAVRRRLIRITKLVCKVRSLGQTH